MLSNMSHIFSYFYCIYTDWLENRKLLYRYKVFLFKIWCFKYNSFSKPNLVIFPRLVDSRLASYEVGSLSNVMSLGLVDSVVKTNEL